MLNISRTIVVGSMSVVVTKAVLVLVAVSFSIIMSMFVAQTMSTFPVVVVYGSVEAIDLTTQMICGIEWRATKGLFCAPSCSAGEDRSLESAGSGSAGSK